LSDDEFITEKIKEVLIKIADGLKIMAEWAKKVGAKKSQNFDKIEITKNLPSSWLVK